MLLVCLLVASTQMTWGLVVPVLPVYADGLGASPAALGAAVAVFGVGRLLTNVPGGLLAQRLDRHRALLLSSVAVVGVLTLLTALVQTTPQLLVLRLLTGAAGGVAITVGQLVLSETAPARWDRTMSSLQAFQLAGGSVGPVVGGLTVAVDARLPFVVAGGLLLATVLVACARPLPSREVPTTAPAVPGADRPRPRLWSRGLVAVCVVGLAVFLVRFGGMQYLAPVLAYEEAGMTPGQLGLVLGGVTVLGLLLLPVAAAVSRRAGRARVVTVAVLLLGASCLLLLGAQHPAQLVAAVVLVGVLTTAAGPAVGAALAEHAPPGRRGAAVGVYRTSGDVGTLVGPLVLGALVGAGRWEAAVVVLGVVPVAAGVAFAVLGRGRRRGGGGGAAGTSDGGPPTAAPVVGVPAGKA